MKRVVPATLAVVLIFAASMRQTRASVISESAFTSPTVESFEGVVGVSVPRGLFSGGMYGAPPTGFVLGSGLTLVGPSPNPSNGADFIIGDFNANSGGGGYGLLENGNISSPADLKSGTAFAGAGNPVAPVNTFSFSFPFPVNLVGTYVSSVNPTGPSPSVPVTLTIYDSSSTVIESHTFTSIAAVPLTSANFIGLGSATPIAGFSISSTDFFVFDDVKFQATAVSAVPEPSTLTATGLGLMMVLGLALRRRSR